jgi:hypothetical protein
VTAAVRVPAGSTHRFAALAEPATPTELAESILALVVARPLI